MITIETLAALTILGIICASVSLPLLSKSAAIKYGRIKRAMHDFSTMHNPVIVFMWRDARNETRPAAILIGVAVPSAILSLMMGVTFLTLLPLGISVGAIVIIHRAFQFSNLMYAATEDGVHRALIKSGNKIEMAFFGWDEIHITQPLATGYGPATNDLILVRDRNKWVVGEMMVNFDHFCRFLPTKIASERFWPTRVLKFVENHGRLASSSPSIE